MSVSAAADSAFVQNHPVGRARSMPCSVSWATSWAAWDDEAPPGSSVCSGWSGLGWWALGLSAVEWWALG